MPSYDWVMVAKIVHQLKLLQFFRSDGRSPSMTRVINDLSEAHDYLDITLQAPDKKCSLDSFPRGVPAVQFYNRSPSVTEDFDICQSYITALSSRHQYLYFIQSNGALSESYDNFMPAAYLRVQIRNLMFSRKNALNKC